MEQEGLIIALLITNLVVNILVGGLFLGIRTFQSFKSLEMSQKYLDDMKEITSKAFDL